MPSFNSKFSGGGGALVVTDLEVDSGTLSIDETNNRVGIGDTAPGTQLQLKGTAPYVTIQNSTSENSDGGCESKLIFEDHANASLGQIEVSHSGVSDDTKGKMILSTHTGSSLTAAVTIDEAQKVTAAGDVQVTGDIILDDGGSLKEAGGTAAITFDGSGHVTKIGQDSPSTGHFLKYDGAKWVADAVATGSSAADDITTGDAAVTIATSSGNITLDAQAGDADIIFKGTDDTADITALTLDMSDAGAALFNAGVTVGTDIIVSGGDATLGTAGNTTATTISTVTNTGTTVGKSLTISAGSTTTGANNLNGGDLILASGDGDGTGTSSIQFKTKVSGTDAAAERMRVHTNGYVGIGTAAPATSLHVAGGPAYMVIQNTINEHGPGEAESRIVFADHEQNFLAQVEASHVGSGDDDKGQLIFSTNNDSGLVTALTIDETQLATFAGDVIVTGGDITLGAAADSNNTTLIAVTESGTNTDGKTLTIGGGLGTGTGTPGKVEITSGIPAGSGSSAHTATPVAVFDSIGATLNYGGVDVLVNDESVGEKVFFGTGQTVKGKLYCLNTSGAWVLTDADDEATTAALIAVACGGDGTGGANDAATHGMLIRGFIDNASALTGTFNEGIPIYVDTVTAGNMTVTRPSASNDFVRVVGWACATANVIYFNPSNDYIEL